MVDTVAEPTMVVQTLDFRLQTLLSYHKLYSLCSIKKYNGWVTVNDHNKPYVQWKDADNEDHDDNGQKESNDDVLILDDNK